MPQINIETTIVEQEAVLKVIKAHNGEVLSVRAIAEEANLKQSRARYALVDLLDAGKIVRKEHKMFNKNYIRYIYEIA